MSCQPALPKGLRALYITMLLVSIFMTVSYALLIIGGDLRPLKIIALIFWLILSIIWVIVNLQHCPYCNRENKGK